jgi:hypothetical protein
MRVLAEPNLVTLSGRAAVLHAGGEVPRPQFTVNGDIDYTIASTTIPFAAFGVKLNFVPVVLGNDGIRVLAQPQPSEVAVDLNFLAEGIAGAAFAVTDPIQDFNPNVPLFWADEKKKQAFAGGYNLEVGVGIDFPMGIIVQGTAGYMVLSSDIGTGRWGNTEMWSGGVTVVLRR